MRRSLTYARDPGNWVDPGAGSLGLLARLESAPVTREGVYLCRIFEHFYLFGEPFAPISMSRFLVYCVRVI